MKKFFWILPFALLAFSCSIEELNTPESNNADRVFARIESVDENATRVYADENLKVLWDADDRISLFKKSTYNKQYRFTGSTGANSGEFVDVNPDAVVTGNALDYVYSVYPYKAETTISNDGGAISTMLPAEQTYREGTFGIGANTMVSATTNTELVFKNLCGYIVLKLYGEDVSVASITLTGKNSEPLAGGVNVTASVGNDPSFTFSGTATTTLTLNCPTPVTLGSTAEQATTFWLVVPPTTFTNGFTVTVTDKNGGSFEKSSSSKTVISRNSTFRMKPLAVEIEAPSQPNNVIYYTTSNGSVVNLRNSDKFGVPFISNEYVEGRGVITFDGDVTTIAYSAFLFCSELTSISLPATVTSIENGTFSGCSSLTSFIIPEAVTSIGQSAFNGCSSFTSITIPESVTSIGDGAFVGCSSLMSFGGKFASSDGFYLIDQGVLLIAAPAAMVGSVSIPDDVSSIGNRAFYGCTSLTGISVPETLSSIGNSAFSGCSGLSNFALPEGITSIGDSAFAGCSALTNISFPESVRTIGTYSFESCRGLTSLVIPETVTSIGRGAFSGCTGLTSITVLGQTPPSGSSNMFNNTNNCPIYVYSENVVDFISGEFWSEYSTRYCFTPATIEALLDKFNPNAYLIYRANKTEYDEGRNYYSIQSNMPGFTGAKKVEMKFQLAEGKDKVLASDNIGSDSGYSILEMKDGHFIWYSWDDDDDDDCFNFDVTLNSYGLNETDLFIFTFDGVNSSLSLNNQTWDSPRDKMGFGHLFAQYYSENDEGRRTVYTGVPDGSKLYYVKTWDENDNLMSLSFATAVRNPKTGNNEYSWFSYYPNTGKLSYNFANDAENQGGYLGGYSY